MARTGGILAAVLVSGLTAAAHASTISTNTNPSEDVYQAGTNDMVSMVVYAGYDNDLAAQAVFFLPTDSTVPDPTTTDPNCRSRPTGASSCAIRDKVRVMGGTANDLVNVGGAGNVVEFHGGDGNDRIFSTSGTRIVAYGDAGNDDLAGSYTGAVFNQLDGGAGDDKLTVSNQFDTVTGGPGFDTLQTTGNDNPVTITLDGLANDGTAGQTQNIAADVEKVVGGNGNDDLTGNNGANTLDGASGNDTLTGLGGADTLIGGNGDDTIYAHDGVADSVSCGPGTDHVFADPVDTVAGDCETLTYADDDHDGFAADVDCDDHNATTHPGAVDTPGDGIDQDCSGGDAPLPPGATDADNDGSVPPADCNDHNAAIRPGATDIPGNGVDENCDGHDAPFPAIASPVTNRWLSGSTTRVVKLEVTGVPAGGKVRVKCKGRSCPFKSKTARISGGRAKLTPLFKRHKLRPGVKIEITITAPAMIGKFVRFTVLKRQIPKVTTLCVPPGATTPSRC